jgi:hypothetical protein
MAPRGYCLRWAKIAVSAWNVGTRKASAGCGRMGARTVPVRSTLWDYDSLEVSTVISCVSAADWDRPRSILFDSEIFCLEIFPFARRTHSFFEMDGRLSIQHHNQMSGNPVKIRDGCATVTATNSQCHWMKIPEGGSEV